MMMKPLAVDMAKRLVLLMLLTNLVSTLAEEHEKQLCNSPQFFEVGETATLNCSFPVDYFGIFWYNTADYIFAYPIVYLKDSIKAGEGYESGEFDINDDGSLVILNISLEHDHNFTGTLLESPDSRTIVINVAVFVIVKPSSGFPVIDVCGNDSRICSTKVNDTFELNCFLSNARPPVILKWMQRRAMVDDIILYDDSVVPTGLSYTTRASTISTFSRSSLLMLFVCQAIALPGMLEKNEAMILIQNEGIKTHSTQPIQRHFERNSVLNLECGADNPMYLVWKMKPSYESFFHDILFSVYFNVHFTQIYSHEFTVGNSGTLFLPVVKVEHEGVYRCLYGGYYTDGLATYQVSVYVNPVPAYPSIAGCDHKTRYCILEVERKGTLTCYLNGIRPEVNLELRVYDQNKGSAITFSNHERFVRRHGETFDIVLTSTYDATHFLENRVTVECKVVEMPDVFSHLTTSIDLLFSIEIMPNKATERDPRISNGRTQESLGPLTIFVITWVISSAVAILIVSVIFLQRRRTSIISNRRISTDPENQRTHKFPDELEPMMDKSERSGNSDIIEKLVEALKAKYETLYEAVQPIPYIKDRLFRVDKVFVEVGIKLLISNNDEDEDSWNELESYHDILDDSKIKSSRRILEGEPGYGKSTLTLQFAYDWSTKSSESTLSDIDIFILLQLRQLKGVRSFYRAIKQFLLPKDSTLSENDLKNAINECNKLVIVLDGFDEYPDQDSKIETDIKQIIKNEMLQNSKVILTTRVRLPEALRFPTQKRVKLTGFSEQARDDYIKKAIVGDDTAANEIKKRLEKNAVLGALCQVPLFFVMFAHMTYENKDFKDFSSVTKFFRYMVSCFHTHLKNKLDDHGKEKCKVFEQDHSKLDIVAFKGLTGKKQQKIVWDKNELCNQIGQDFYEHYKQIGILVEEDVLELLDKPGVSAEEHVQSKTQVRFYHKLFCEWYAAHRLSQFTLSACRCKVYNTLKHIDPFDLQYVYRFACGLNTSAADTIIKYLRGDMKTFENFVILCILEKSGRTEEIKDDVREICSNNIRLRHSHSSIMLWSTIQLLQVASTNRIPISSLYFDKCFNQVRSTTWEIELKNADMSIPVPVLKSVKEIVIKGVRKEMADRETSAVLNYASMCEDLKIIRFHDFILPRSFQHETLLSSSTRCDFKVLWHTEGPDLRLNLKSGRWESYYDGTELTDANLDRLMQDFYPMIQNRPSAAVALPSSVFEGVSSIPSSHVDGIEGSNRNLTEGTE